MAAAAAAASAAAETAEANNKNKNCHFREDAPKRSPLFACCSPTCDKVCLSVSHAVDGPFVWSRALGHRKQQRVVTALDTPLGRPLAAASVLSR